MENKRLKGIIFCFIAAISWGITFPLLTIVLKQMDIFAITTIRYTAALPVFLFFLIKKEGLRSLKIPDKSKLSLWFFGSCGFVGFGFLVGWGQHLIGNTGALNASVIAATMPILGIIVNFLLNRKKPPLFSFIFIFLSFIGVLLVITQGNIFDLFNSPENYLADSLIFLGALGWVLYTIGMQYFPDFSSLKYTTFSLLYGVITIFIIDIICFSQGIVVIPSTDQLLIVAPQLVYISLISGFVGVLCWNVGNKILTPLNGVLFINLVPVTAFIVSALQGIMPSLIQILGALITIIALFLNNFFQRENLHVKT